MSEPQDIERILASDRALRAAEYRYDHMTPPEEEEYHFDDCLAGPGDECDCADRVEEDQAEAEIARHISSMEDRAYEAEHDRSWEP